jgi:hypothetical protein
VAWDAVTGEQRAQRAQTGRRTARCVAEPARCHAIVVRTNYAASNARRRFGTGFGARFNAIRRCMRAGPAPGFRRRKQKAGTRAMSVFAEVLQYRPFRRVFPPAGAGRIFFPQY